MPSTNGHGPETAILYVRVSSEERAKKGYSIRQQLERGRQRADEEGWEVLSEIRDEGYSGASLARPGMDQVRELVSRGGVAVVWAQDRDRFAREPAYLYLLKKEFEEYGTKLTADNDRGDESPEGELTDGILDQLAKYERAKIAERSRRGKLRKAREGRVVSPIAKYGFRFNEARDGLVVHEPEMAVVEKIFRMAAEGCGVGKIQSRLYAEGIPSPRGREVWDRRVIRRIVASDEYRPLPVEEIEKLVAPEVAVRLEPSKEYAVQWYNRNKATVRTVSESDGNGGRRYRKHKTLQRRPRDEWLAIPISAYLPRDLVVQARATMEANTGAERKRLAREWELRSLMRCSCGSKMQTKTTNPHGHIYHYYYCVRRHELRGMCACTQQALRAAEVEAEVWEFISDLLMDPEKVDAGMRRLIEQERNARRGDPEREAEMWAERIAECVRLRSAYQDQQAAGLMTLKELASKLNELDETRTHAERELAALKDSQERIAELQSDRDALVKYVAELPIALDNLTGEERNRVYRMLRLEVSPTPEGYQVSGAFCTNGQMRVRLST